MNTNTTTHPASAGLRELADWLDVNGDYLNFDGVYLRLKQETPESFARSVTDISAKVDTSLQFTVFAHGELCGVKAMVIAQRDKVGSRRVVTREEFVIGEAA